MLFLAEALGPRFIDEQFKADSSSAYVTTMHSAFGRQNTVKMAGLEYKGREDIEKKREDAVQGLLHQDLPLASLASAASEKFFQDYSNCEGFRGAGHDPRHNLQHPRPRIESLARIPRTGQGSILDRPPGSSRGRDLAQTFLDWALIPGCQGLGS